MNFLHLVQKKQQQQKQQKSYAHWALIYDIFLTKDEHSQQFLESGL